MWDLGNRGVIALVSVLSGCVFLYNVWGPIFILTISLCLTIYACHFLIIHDSLLSPHAFLLFDYCKHISVEAYRNFENIVDYVCRYTQKFWEIANRRFRERRLTQIRMDRRRGSHYQLSSDAYSTQRSSSKFGLISQLSPISKTVQKLDGNAVRPDHHRFSLNSNLSLYDQNSLPKQSSTPIYRHRKEDYNASSADLLSGDGSLSKQLSPMYAQSRTFQDENSTYFVPEGSPWGASISPKARGKTNEVRDAPTVGGPLSTSNRCNIDPKIYNDVTSPGLATRLTKYAAEASNKLNQQIQYRVGQFPKVNFNASPIPLINAKSVKTRTPVTVRVAPPDIIRCSPPGKQKIFWNIHRLDDTCSSPSVAHALREISLKRQASREDVTLDLAKKQRTDSILSNEFEIQDEIKQKRSREESSKSEEDISPLSKNARPTKRTKTPSCYDILNSLSSSKHVISGVKRKARDFSRSGTPDFEKHFKSLECVQNTSMQSSPLIQNTNMKHYSHERIEENHSDICASPKKILEHSPLKGILKPSSNNAAITSKITDINAASIYDKKDDLTMPVMSTESAKLTNKLFMKAEPERNERLRMLVEEQGNIRAKFTTDDVEEIKREDIADMRQTSMKARLQSMFDAISGKANRINPDVVIQAEEVNAVKLTAVTPTTCATLNSSTTTTTVNTTPISASSIVSGPFTTESNTSSPKHVTFNLPNKESSSNANVLAKTKAESVSVSKQDVTASKLGVTFAAASVPSTTGTTVVTNASLSGTFTFNAASSDRKPSTATTSSIITPTTTTSLHQNTNNTVSKSSVVSQIANNTSSPNFSFGSNSNATFISTNSGTPNITATKIKGLSRANMPAISTTNASVAPIKDIANTTSVNPTAATTIGASNSLFTFGSQTNNTQTTKPPEAFVFGPTGNTPKSSNMFESSVAPQHSNAGNPTASTTSTSVLSTSGPALNTATTSAFDSNVKMTSTFGSSTNSTFTFGTSVGSSGKTGFSFGTPTTSANTTAETTNAATFGTSKSTNFTFGNSATSNNSQFTSNTTSVFGNPTTASMFGSTSQSVFGTPSSSATVGTFPAPKSTTAPIFRSNSETTTANTMAAFSNTPSTCSGTTTAPPVPLFGSSTNTATGVTGASSSLFNAGATSSTSAFGATNNIFGQTKSPPTCFKSSNSVFGSNATSLFGTQSTTTTTATTTVASVFGNTNVSTVTTTPTFGSSNVSSGSTTIPAFGAPSAPTPVFESQNNVGLRAQSPTAQAFGSGAPIFRSSAAPTPVFGASNKGGPFNSPVSNTFGSSSNTTNSVFGTTANTSTFGETKTSPFSSQASAFGTPNTSVPAFRSDSIANTGNSGTSNIFTFGGNQKPPQLNATFSFGNNNAANNVTAAAAASTSAAPFQFGATATSKPAAGFNFTAPTTTPSINFGTTGTPAFNASTPGMFNIGSGSIAPRSRNIRIRKPR